MKKQNKDDSVKEVDTIPVSKDSDSTDVVEYESRPNGGFSVYYTLPESSESKSDKLQQLIDSIKNNIGEDTAEDESYEDFTSNSEESTEDYSRELYDLSQYYAYVHKQLFPPKGTAVVISSNPPFRDIIVHLQQYCLTKFVSIMLTI